MPIPSQYNLPPTVNEDEFEDMVEDYFKLSYPNAQRYGRKGQKQYGLDITYTISSAQQLIGVQCKKYSVLNTRDIDAIIRAVGNFCIPIDNNSSLEIISLIIATTASRDEKIQKYVLQKRQELNKEIKILFWEDIKPVIAGNTMLLQKYYPMIYSHQQSNSITIESLINTFNVAIRNYSILNFISIDPFLGMPDDLPCSVDMFNNTIKSSLDNAIILQNDEVFIAINNFNCLLNSYNGYLSELMYPTNNGFYSFEKRNQFIEWEKIKSDIENIKIELNRLYSIINKGCVLFY